jgi:hypothetical protein
MEPTKVAIPFRVDSFLSKIFPSENIAPNRPIKKIIAEKKPVNSPSPEVK